MPVPPHYWYPFAKRRKAKSRFTLNSVLGNMRNRLKFKKAWVIVTLLTLKNSQLLYLSPRQHKPNLLHSYNCLISSASACHTHNKATTADRNHSRHCVRLYQASYCVYLKSQGYRLYCRLIYMATSFFLFPLKLRQAARGRLRKSQERQKNLSPSLDFQL